MKHMVVYKRSVVWLKIIIPGALDKVNTFKTQFNNGLLIMQQTQDLILISCFPIVNQEGLFGTQ